MKNKSLNKGNLIYTFLTFIGMILALQIMGIKKLLFVIICFCCASVFAQQFSVKSPDGKISANLSVQGDISLSILVDGKITLSNAKIGMQTSKGDFDGTKKAIASKLESVSEIIKVPFGIRGSTENNYNLLTVNFEKFDILLRAYNDAVAYRFVAKMGRKGRMQVISETLDFNLEDSTDVIAHVVKGDKTSFEDRFLRLKAGDMKNYHSASLPFFLKTQNCMLVLVESNLSSFPALRVCYKNGLGAYHSKYPKAREEKGWHYDVSQTEDFIAINRPNKQFPWRAFIVARNDADLLANDTVFKLANPSQLDDVSWITTGMGSWDVWTRNEKRGYCLHDSITNKSFREHIDFVASQNHKYLLIDAGWLKHFSKTSDVVSGELSFDVRSIIEYAHSKNLKVLLWVLAKNIEQDAKSVIDRVQLLGADGMKVDFFDRDDQLSIELLERIAYLCAERKMVVDFHGCPPPTGLNRTYPNVIGFEAVMGQEFNNFSNKITPSHSVDVAFSRLLQGPLDYTPGATICKLAKGFTKSRNFITAPATRAHQTAMVVFYFVPFQCICFDLQSHSADIETTSFVSNIPTTWDESVSLGGEMGKYALIARRKGDVWYVAGMNAGEKRTVEIDFSKILQSNADVEIYSDSLESSQNPMCYELKKMSVASDEKLKIEMALDGGFVMKLTPKKFSIFGFKLF